MISNHWIDSRKPQWDRLQTLLQQCGNSGISNLNRSELRELGLLYRQVAADLSILRQDRSGANYARHVNELLGRAHSIIYTGRKTSFRSITVFFTDEWPRLVHSLRGYIATTAAIFFLCAMAGALLTIRNTDFALQVLGPTMIDSIDRHEMWTHSIVGMKPMASSSIMTNNLAVCFMTFAMGVTAGLGTIYMIAFNGLLLGVIGAACGTHKMSLDLWSFVVGHGALEIPAILLAGAAGLRIATGILFPGNLTRRESLRVAGSEAVKLEIGTIPLLVVAGLIEGFVSPTSLPVSLKMALGAALFTALMIWVSRGWKSSTVNSSVSLPGTYSTQPQ